MPGIIKAIAPWVLILILAVFFGYGAYTIGKSQGAAITQAKQDAAIIKEDKKLEEDYAKVKVPANRADAVKRMLLVAKAHNL